MSGGTIVTNGGILAGVGRMEGSTAVDTGGRIQVGAGQTMQLSGTVTNRGNLDVQATTGSGHLQVAGYLTNYAAAGAIPAGQMNLLNAEVHLNQGMTNAGRLNIAGFTTISGAVDNVAGGRMNVSGVGANAILWDNFHNDGTVMVTGGSTLSVFGLTNGVGTFSSTGTKNLAGGYTPGNSPALVSMEGEIIFSFGDITMELAGLNPGNGAETTTTKSSSSTAQSRSTPPSTSTSSG